MKRVSWTFGVLSVASCQISILIHETSAFLPTTPTDLSHCRRQNFPASSSSDTTFEKSNVLRSKLFAAASDSDQDDDEDDDDDDEGIDLDVGDWRKFRASLIDSGLPGGSSEDDDRKKEQKSKPSVAKENEKLLEAQNKELAKEYQSGVWAHVVAEPEVGGLLLRLPLEAELYLGSSGGYWNEKLKAMLSLELSNSPNKRVDEEDETLSDAKVAQ